MGLNGNPNFLLQSMKTNTHSTQLVINAKPIRLDEKNYPLVADWLRFYLIFLCFVIHGIKHLTQPSKTDGSRTSFSRIDRQVLSTDSDIYRHPLFNVTLVTLYFSPVFTDLLVDLLLFLFCVSSCSLVVLQLCYRDCSSFPSVCSCQNSSCICLLQ